MPIMARGRSSPPEPPEPRLKATRARAKEIIDRGISEAGALLEQAAPLWNPDEYQEWSHDYERWDARTMAALASAFEGPFPDEFHRSATSRIVRHIGQSDATTMANRQEAIKRAINTLRSIEERMVYLEEPGDVVEARPRTLGGRQIFVIHGRDEGLRARVARLLERLSLDAIILQEQADRGRTVIEKFEDHALEVGFAVALLTPDDTGKGPDDKDWPETPNRAPPERRPRTRLLHGDPRT